MKNVTSASGRTDSRLDATDRRILEQLQKHPEGCKIGPIIKAATKSEGVCRYRLLTLEASGLVKAVRERGATTYFLNLTQQEV
jgi:DNA-binding Lrp family transcriptional regulator